MSEQAASAPRGAKRPRRNARPIYRLPNGSFIVLGPAVGKAVRAANGDQKADVEEYSEEELAVLMSALDEANEAAERVIAALDRSHEAIQSLLRNSHEYRERTA